MTGSERPDYRGTYRVAVIAHTGKGNYGHQLDQASVGLPDVTIVAIADPDEAGRTQAMRRTGAAAGYADYQEMLAREQPDIVVLAAAHLEAREATFLAAVESGARGIFTEKPFARSLDVADRLLAAADARGVKVAIAHQNRVRSGPKLARHYVQTGELGRLRVIKTVGKCDQRGGGHDLLWLGTHLMDMMRLLAGAAGEGADGDARWCQARVTQAGRDVTPSTVRQAGQGIGPVAGDDVTAQFGFDNGVTGSFESTVAHDGGGNQYLHTEVSGTGGTLVFWNDAEQPAYFNRRPFFLPPGATNDAITEGWECLPLAPIVLPGITSTSPRHAANQSLVCDLLAAIEQDRQPGSSGHDGRASLEMIMAVYESHRQGQRVALPLARREHPLAQWT